MDGTLLVTTNIYSFKDGKLILNSEDGGRTWDGWNSLTPDIDCNTFDTHQWEFHIEFESRFPEDVTSPWIATIIGARVSDYVSSMPIPMTEYGWLLRKQSNYSISSGAEPKNIGRTAL